MSNEISELQKYRSIAENLLQLYEDSALNYADETEDCFNELVHTLDDSNYKVVVMGTFSRGKSTFLNSIIGKRLLFEADKEATGAVTYIQNAKEPRITIKTDKGEKYYTVDSESYQKIKEYVDINNKNASATKLLLEYPIDGFDPDIVFIDTPGLAGLGKDALKVTRKAMEEADAVVMLLSYKGLDQDEIELLRGTSPGFGSIRTDTLIFVINKIGLTLDGVPVAEEEAKIERFKEEIRKILKRENIYEKFRNVKIYAVDSRDYLQSVDHETYIQYKHDETRTEEQNKMELRRRSRFNEFRAELVRFLESGSRAVMVRDRLISEMTVLCELMEEHIRNGIKDNHEISEERKKHLDEQMKLLSKEKRSIQNQLLTFIRTQLLGVNEDIEKTSEVWRKNMEKKYEKLIQDQFSSISSFVPEKYSGLTKFIKGDMAGYKKQLQDELLLLYKSLSVLLYNYTGEKLRKFNPKIKAEYNVDKITVDEAKVDKIELTDDLEHLKEDIKKNEKRCDSLKQKISEINKKTDNIRINFPKKEREIRDEFSAEIRKLGNRPGPLEKTEYYTVEKKVFLFIKKNEQRSRTVLDYSRCQEYDRRKKALENKYEEKYNRLAAEKSKLTSEYSKLKTGTEIELGELINEIKRQKETLKHRIEMIEQRNKKLQLEKQQDMLDYVTMNVVDKAFRSLSYSVRRQNEKLIQDLQPQIEDNINRAVEAFRETLLAEKQKLSVVDNSNYDNLLAQLMNVKNIINEGV